MTPGPSTTNRTAWSGHLTDRDYQVMFRVFGFSSKEEMRAFAEGEQAKSDRQQSGSFSRPAVESAWEKVLQQNIDVITLKEVHK